jgi:hypothetical protein
LGVTGDAVAKARADHGGLVAAVDALNRQGRLQPVDESRRSAFEEFIARYHVGDPAHVSDSWRLQKRRDRLFREAHALTNREVS